MYGILGVACTHVGFLLCWRTSPTARSGEGLQQGLVARPEICKWFPVTESIPKSPERELTYTGNVFMYPLAVKIIFFNAI